MSSLVFCCVLAVMASERDQVTVSTHANTAMVDAGSFVSHGARTLSYEAAAAGLGRLLGGAAELQVQFRTLLSAAYRLALLRNTGTAVKSSCQDWKEGATADPAVTNCVMTFARAGARHRQRRRNRYRHLHPHPLRGPEAAAAGRSSLTAVYNSTG